MTNANYKYIIKTKHYISDNNHILTNIISDIPSENFNAFHSHCKSREIPQLFDMGLEEAVEQAIAECIQEGILSEFLKKNRSEAKSVSIYEYDMEKHMRMERAEAREEGRNEGRNLLLFEMLQKKLEKGKSISRIAEELELTEETVRGLLEELDRI